MSGVEPLSEAYESPVLTVELHRHFLKPNETLL